MLSNPVPILVYGHRERKGWAGQRVDVDGLASRGRHGLGNAADAVHQNLGGVDRSDYLHTSSGQLENGGRM